MRIRFGTFICCIGVFGATLQAQTTKDVQRMLQDSLLKQQVYLRNLSAQRHVNAHWDGNKVVLAMPYVYMLSGILVTSVKVDSKHIEIRVYVINS